MIISVHVPRTGGTSFLHYLRSQFPNRIHEDYSWSNVPADPSAYAEYDCIHGHFFARRYIGINGAKFAFWFREPLSRIRSHYSFWKENNFPTNALWLQMHHENWSFEQFALCNHNSIRNLQSQLLDLLGIDQLDFVGVTEQYRRSLRLFEEMYELANLETTVRARETTPMDWESLPGHTINAIRRLHAEDFEIYDQARRRFDQLATERRV